MEVEFAISLLASQGVAQELVRASAFQRRFLRLRLLVFQCSLALVRQPRELGPYRYPTYLDYYENLDNGKKSISGCLSNLGLI
jgi:hypothetical protein